ncbi:hypothetical protein DOZ80_14400 [Pseudomonas fluorescens]|uniref:Uncharacterized protein n=1 Tax=Pseudomonas fluorescens TaxID=294 RepID=A0A327N9S5_PSEFL|nr:hypothetical protein DOZ80_14400 [Pseudomonas fluorescens]
MLAMVVNDNAGSLHARGVWSFIASKLAPTGWMLQILISWSVFSTKTTYPPPPVLPSTSRGQLV